MTTKEIAEMAEFEISRCDPDKWGGSYAVEYREGCMSCGWETFDDAVRGGMLQCAPNLHAANLVWEALLSYNTKDSRGA